MKKLILTLSFFCAFNVIAEDSQELKFLGKTIIHENGSWVNPEEPEWKLKKPKIIYGGSVNPKNITELKKISLINGFLIGGASQNSKNFIDIIKKTIN